MKVKYQIEANSELQTSTRDWVGLFRVGWTSSRDYYTFEWAPEPSGSSSETREGQVKFAGRRLPPENGHFYQLCYVSRDGAIRGASAPFQFASQSLDDMELVEVTDDSINIMVLQKVPKESLHRESKETRAVESEVAERSFTLVQAEKEVLDGQTDVDAVREERDALQGKADSLTAELGRVSAEKDKFRGEMARLQGQIEKAQVEKEACILDLERQVAIHRETVQNLKRELEHERENSRDFLSTSESEKQQLQELKKQVSALKSEVATLSNQNKDLRQDLDQERVSSQHIKATSRVEKQQLQELKEQVSILNAEVATLYNENEDWKQQLQIKESQTNDLQQFISTREEELEQVRMKMHASEQQNAQLNVICTELRTSLDESRTEVASLHQQLSKQGSLCVNIDALLEEKDSKVERLEQDLAVAQENISELMGARNKIMEHPQQQTPSLPPNVVDKKAYDALQQAYDTMVAYFKEEQMQREKLTKQMKTIQETNKILETEKNEMVERVRQCKKQYELKAQECIEYQRCLKKEKKVESGLSASTEVELQKRLTEMEQMQEQLVKDSQEAAQELSIRSTERDALQKRISGLENEVVELTLKYNNLEDRYDRKIAGKNEELQRQKLVFDQKATELAEALNIQGELEAQVAHLKQQIDKIRQHRGTTEDAPHTCPVCNIKFPFRMQQEEFEKHVNAHFDNSHPS